MILMILVIISLIFWFFFAKVTLYARSSAIRLTDNGRLLVTFPKETIGQIKLGQAAMLRLRSDSNGKIVGIPAIVFSIDTQNNLWRQCYQREYSHRAFTRTYRGSQYRSCQCNTGLIVFRQSVTEQLSKKSL
jgi:hypothetical protein